MDHECVCQAILAAIGRTAGKGLNPETSGVIKTLVLTRVNDCARCLLTAALCSVDKQLTTAGTLRGAGHVTQPKPMTSSISPSSSPCASSIPDPQAYMINPLQQQRSQFNPSVPVCVDTWHTGPVHAVI